MSRALLDTDILSEVLKNRDVTVARAAADYLAKHGEFTVSTDRAMLKACNRTAQPLRSTREPSP